MRPAILLVLVGCGAELGPGGADLADDDSPRPDAAVFVPTPDAPAAVADNACGVASAHGDLGALTAQAASVLQDGSTTQRITYVMASIPLTAMQATPDLVVVQLWDNFGAFAGGAARPGTFQITGAETDYDTCGVCLLQLANFANNTAAKTLMATSGTITVTSVGAGTGQSVQLRVSNASFVEIASDPTTGSQPVVGSSCPSPITNVGLTGTIQ